MSFGLTNLGFIPKRLNDVRAELEALFRDSFGAGLKLTPDTTFGKFIGILADREASLWELAEAVYNAAYPNSANDISLARLGEITGITPNPATRSTAVVYLAGTGGTVVPVGSLMAVQDAGDQFRLTGDVTIEASSFSLTGITRSGSTATATSAGVHGLVVGDHVFINGADQAEYNGLHAVTAVPTSTTFEYTVSGTPATPATGTLDVDPATLGNAESAETGPIQALASTLNQIVNAVPGWARVENALDATKGENAETDAAFRTRRLNALKGLGAASLEALRGAVLLIDGVSQAKVFENASGVTDAQGRPPYSFEALVVGGADQNIVDTIFDKKSAGIDTYGTTSGTATDSQGVNHAIKFSRPAVVAIYLELDLTTNADYPADGNTQVESRVLAFGDALDIGEDVVVFPSLVSSFADVPGITDVVVRIGTTPGPTLDDNIVIGDTDVAEFDSTRIAVMQV